MINAQRHEQYDNGVFYPDNKVCHAAGIAASETVPFVVGETAKTYLDELAKRLMGELVELRQAVLEDRTASPAEPDARTITETEEQLCERLGIVKSLHGWVEYGIDHGIEWLLMECAYADQREIAQQQVA